VGWEDLLHFAGSAEEALVTCKLPFCEVDGWVRGHFPGLGYLDRNWIVEVWRAEHLR
jgi:hypothetical protein